MNYRESLTYLDGLNVFGVRLGLARIQRLLELLGTPQDHYRTIHVTGTNGKGSVSAMLATILQQSSIRTGLYISPHLVSYTERMQIDGQPISEADFAACLTAVREKIDEMMAEGAECPTQFEALTAAAFYYFAKKKVEYAVSEVGLGGLLDSTNVITPEVSVITNVALEHAKLCGGTLAGVAHHKAGIIKDGIPVVTAATGMPLAIIRETAENHSSDIFVEGEDFSVEAGEISPRGQKFFFSSTIAGVSRDLYALHLLGAHQVQNAGLAIMAAYLLHNGDQRINEKTVHEALRLVVWPGRFEVLEVPAVGAADDQITVIDGAHNPAGMTVLRRGLDDYFPTASRVLLLGILHDKAVDEMLKILVRPDDIVVVTPPQSDRAEKAPVLAEKARAYAKTVEYYEDNRAALARAMELAGGRRLLVCAGSLYLIGGLRQVLLGKAELPEQSGPSGPSEGRQRHAS